ncbi:DUF4429 domain-containing protein [Holzapfeliella sp. JNUCC 80]
MEKEFYFKTNKITVIVDDYTLSFSRKGFWNFIEFGSKGSKSINLKDITSIQFKPAKTFSRGFLQFVFPGSLESKGSARDAFKDENSITFFNDENQIAEELKSHIESIIHKQPEPQQATSSAADEIKKLKELLDQDILTQDEFDAKKKELLGL